MVMNVHFRICRDERSELHGPCAPKCKPTHVHQNLLQDILSCILSALAKLVLSVCLRTPGRPEKCIPIMIMSLNDASYNQVQNAIRIKWCSKVLGELRPFEHLFNVGWVDTRMTQIRLDQARSPGTGPPGAGSLPPKMRIEIFTLKKQIDVNRYLDV